MRIIAAMNACLCACNQRGIVVSKSLNRLQDWLKFSFLSAVQANDHALMYCQCVL